MSRDSMNLAYIINVTIRQNNDLCSLPVTCFVPNHSIQYGKSLASYTHLIIPISS